MASPTIGEVAECSMLLPVKPARTAHLSPNTLDIRLLAQSVAAWYAFSLTSIFLKIFMCGSELHALPETVQKVAAFLQQAGHTHSAQMLDGAARTAQEAADQLGILVGQVAKSIIFKRRSDGVAVLVVASGDKRVDEKKVAALVGPIGRADAEFVKVSTGFSIGGVSPVAHAQKPVVLIDEQLQRFDIVWAAAGHPHAVFAATPAELKNLTAAPWADVAMSEQVAV